MSSSQQDSPNYCQDASIYVTFYTFSSDKSNISNIKEELDKSISEWLIREKYLLDWEDDKLVGFVAEEGATAIQYSKPYEFPRVEDTVVAQIILYIQESSPHFKDAKLGWKSLWKIWKSVSETISNTDIMGCSLIFHASYLDGINSTEAKKEFNSTVVCLKELTSTSKDGDFPDTEIGTKGKIKLLAIPQPHSNHSHLPVPMIYVALSNLGDDTTNFLNDLLWPGEGTLVENDLIVHKSYYQKYQYFSKRNEIEYVREKVVDESKNLLKSSTEDKVRGENLRKISDKAHSLFGLSTYLHKLYTSLRQQEFNYVHLKEHHNFGEIWSYHKERLEEIILDLKLLIEGCDRDFSVARNSVDLVAAQVKEQEEEREKKWQKFAAVIAAALAIPQLVDGEAAFYLLCWVLPVIDPVLHSIGLELKMCTVQLGDEKKRLIGLVVQVFLIVVAALAINVVLDNLAERNKE